MNNPLRHADHLAELYDVMLMEYASGVLDDVMSLLVASHLTLSAPARRHVALYETLGGGLLGECCEPVAMDEGSLKIVLGKLGACGEEMPCALEDLLCEAGISLPQPLQRHMKAHACNIKKWRRARGGSRFLHIPLPANHDHHHALLFRAVSGALIPRLRHPHREYGLVLQGCLRRQHDYFEPGDLFVIENEVMPRPVVDSPQESVCLVVAEGHAHHGWRARLFPFGW